jgi:hypothetical protein
MPSCLFHNLLVVQSDTKVDPSLISLPRAPQRRYKQDGENDYRFGPLCFGAERAGVSIVHGQANGAR